MHELRQGGNFSGGLFKGMPILIVTICILIIGVILSVLYAVTVGSANLTTKQVYDIILYELFHLGDAETLSSGAVHDIVWLIRLPRIIETAKLIGVVAQHNSYDFDFLVQDIVLMGRSPHKSLMERDNAEDYSIMRIALQEVGLEGFESRSFASLSGGEQQRVVLARDLAQKTPVLVLDEPTNHLDIKFQLQLLETVKKQSKTVLAAFHDLNIASMYSDVIYVMHQGKIYRHGSPSEVLTQELIYEVYGVNSRVKTDAEGYPYIQFLR